MSKKFYLISFAFLFLCTLYECAELVKAVSDICFRYGITAKCRCYILGVGRTKQKVNIFFGWDNKMLESKVNEKGRWEVKVKNPVSRLYALYRIYLLCPRFDFCFLIFLLVMSGLLVGKVICR